MKKRSEKNIDDYETWRAKRIAFLREREACIISNPFPDWMRRPWRRQLGVADENKIPFYIPFE